MKSGSNIEVKRS